MAASNALDRISGVDRSTARESVLVWLIGDRYGDSVTAASSLSRISWGSFGVATEDAGFF